MKISSVSLKNYNYNQTKFKNTPNYAVVNFKGAKHELVPILIDSFKTETAKKLYSKMHKYFKIVGDNGSIKNAKILSEESRYYNNLTNNFYNSNEDIFLTIKKFDKNSNLYLSRKSSENSNSKILLDATFDMNGQMIKGYFPPEHLYFERNNIKWSNIRRMGYYNGVSPMSPVSGNDRAWHGILPTNILNIDNSTSGAYEIFIELARLYTSILK